MSRLYSLLFLSQLTLPKKIVQKNEQTYLPARQTTISEQTKKIDTPIESEHLKKITQEEL